MRYSKKGSLERFFVLVLAVCSTRAVVYYSPTRKSENEISLPEVQRQGVPRRPRVTAVGRTGVLLETFYAVFVFYSEQIGAMQGYKVSIDARSD